MFLFVSIKYRSSSLGFSVASFVSAENVSYAEVHHHGSAIPKGNPGNGAVKKAEQKRCEKRFSFSNMCSKDGTCVRYILLQLMRDCILQGANGYVTACNSTWPLAFYMNNGTLEP